MRASTRLGLLGVVLGSGIALWCGVPQVHADQAGVAVMGYAEAMFLLGLPFSVLTWLGWLLPASTVFGSTEGEIPRWVEYIWMAVTPPLNWGLVGWLVGKWREPRRGEHAVH